MSMGGRSGTPVESLLLGSLLLILLAAPVAADGGETYWVIIRESRVEPTQFSAELNQTVQFNNVADSNRTIRIDVDGDGQTNGSADDGCEAVADGHCEIRLDAANWSVGDHLVEVVENGIVLFELNIDIDGHSHSIDPADDDSIPAGHSHDDDHHGTGADGEADETSGSSDSQRTLPSAVVSVIVFACLLVVARVGLIAREQ